MHLFMAALSTETNTFSPIPTDLAEYQAYFMRHGTATEDVPNLMTEALHVWRRRAEALGWRVTESLTAIAEPAGRTTDRAYRKLRAEILDDLRALDGVDVILLQLHGAMVAEGEDDCEGDLVARAREICPGAVIGVALDLHCHLTDRLLGAADLVICFKEYPHDDAPARAEELFGLAWRTARREIRPEMALFDCRMVGMYLTKEGPMRAFVARMAEAERAPGILSVSLGHGFPWADLPETGSRMLVIADGDRELAAQSAEQLGRAFYSLRNTLLPRPIGLPDALARAEAASTRPVVLADMSDNSGAGAPGDATHVLREILDRRLASVASGIHWDPEAVRLCRTAGVGAELELEIGGKAEPASGRPLRVRGRVGRIESGLGQHLGAAIEPLGTLVRLQLENSVDLLISDLRTQVYHPEAFTQMGIELASCSLIVVKSTVHFYSAFRALTPEILFCASPGRVKPDFAGIPYRRRAPDYWPRIADPLGPDGQD